MPGQENTFVLSTPVAVTAGNQYGFVLNGANNSFALSFGEFNPGAGTFDNFDIFDDEE